MVLSLGGPIPSRTRPRESQVPPCWWANDSMFRSPPGRKARLRTRVIHAVRFEEPWLLSTPRPASKSGRPTRLTTPPDPCARVNREFNTGDHPAQRYGLLLPLI